jgi:hypothetical protein
MEDVGRVHDIAEAYTQAEQEDNLVRDIETAHEMALVENEIFDVYEEAKRQNEILDAHAEAIEENKARTQLKEEQQTAEAAKAEKEGSAQPGNEREEAQQALKKAGHLETLPFGSEVKKDPDTGNLLVILEDAVKVIEPMAGGKSHITNFAYSRKDGILKISNEGESSRTMHITDGDYTPVSQLPEGYRPARADIMALPRSVARVVGFGQAVFTPRNHGWAGQPGSQAA